MVTIRIKGKEYQIDENSDDNLMQQLLAQGAEIVSACGGAGICQTCAFTRISGEFSEKTENEEMMDMPEGQRLSCQCKPKTDGEVEMLY